MDITVRRIGTSRGCIGWLRDGLENGTITITEEMRKTGHPLLVVETDGSKIVIGCYNPYGLSDEEVSGSEEYTALTRGHYLNPKSINDTIGCTDACLRTLTAIAQGWADERNEETLAEEPLPVTVKLG